MTPHEARTLLLDFLDDGVFMAGAPGGRWPSLFSPACRRALLHRRVNRKALPFFAQSLVGGELFFSLFVESFQTKILAAFFSVGSTFVGRLVKQARRLVEVFSLMILF